MKSWRWNWLVLAVFAAASFAVGVGLISSGPIGAILSFGFGLGFALGAAHLRRLTVAYDRDMLALHEQDVASRMAGGR